MPALLKGCRGARALAAWIAGAGLLGAGGGHDPAAAVSSVPPFLVHSAETAQVDAAPYSALHPAARARGWWPVDGDDQPAAAPGERHVLYAHTWGGAPFFALPPDVDSCDRVRAIFTELRRAGWTAWHVNVPAVAGSAGALLQPGAPGTYPLIPDLLAESAAWVRAQHGATTVVALGRSGGGISWAWVAGRPAGAYPFAGWRPDALVLLESAPALDRLTNRAVQQGGAEYFGVSDWASIPLATKVAASPLPELASGPGAAVPVLATYLPDASLPGGLDAAGFWAAWTAGGPIPGYANPHGAAGGLGLEGELALALRPAPYRVRWGDGLALNPGGLAGLVDPGRNPAFGVETRLFLEQALASAPGR